MSENSGVSEEKRVALLGIMVSDKDAAAAVNRVLHDFESHIVGRMGLPLREQNINAISVVLVATSNTVNALTGKLGALSGVAAKALFAQPKPVNKQ